MGNQQALGIGFIGSGQMALALAEGWVHKRVCVGSQMTCSDTNDAAASKLASAVGAVVSDSNAGVLMRRHVIVLAVKPQVIKQVCEELAEIVTPDHLFVSIAAGVKLANLEAWLRTGRVIRVMPNTPCLVGQAASALAAGSAATSEDMAQVEKLFKAVGVAVTVPESMLDAVTGLSGSGPAYGYMMIEALADGGVRAGLPRAVALQLAAQTLLGAAAMVLQTNKHPGELKDNVTSPGGTTIAGLAELERAGVRSALIEAVTAASNRAKELAG